MEKADICLDKYNLPFETQNAVLLYGGSRSQAYLTGEIIVRIPTQDKFLVEQKREADISQIIQNNIHHEKDSISIPSVCRNDVVRTESRRTAVMARRNSQYKRAAGEQEDFERRPRCQRDPSFHNRLPSGKAQRYGCHYVPRRRIRPSCHEPRRARHGGLVHDARHHVCGTEVPHAERA